ncbi:MAG: BamA/TamA family outer membrane protein [Elusimicrobia bacterium]|nr:BamA/TamA family outer membrane protein [Elusimicrobiota bacterium]
MRPAARAALTAALLCFGTPPAGARTGPASRSPRSRSVMNWVMADTAEGVRVSVPVIDADPNRGVTVGLMPVWVRFSGGALRRIHAPALTYNAAVGACAAWDFYLFPSSDSVLEAYASIAQRSDREVFLSWESPPLRTRDFSWQGQLQHLRDAGRRFYGVGPRAGRDGETDYTLGSYNYSAAVDIPVRPGSPWAFRAGHHLQAVKVLPGPRRNLPDVEAKHPGAANGRHRLFDAAFRGALVYDSRDSKATASRGFYAEEFAEAARDGWLSDMTYERFGAELKGFLPLGAGSEPPLVAAFQGRMERLYGSVPFWVLPSLGGKYAHRGYGDGRFVDNAAAMAQAELRVRLYRTELSGSPVSFWLDPFVGGGFVAPALGQAQAETFRPVYGASLRAVVRPQVVGAADFGFGQEGLKVFLDLNYAF